DYAGTLPYFYKSLKAAGLSVKDISYVMATHYHPDHMGIIGELMKQGVKLLLIDVQKDHVHYSDHIFERDGISFVPVDEAFAYVISCRDSRAFLSGIGICGEIIHTPSHSEDSVTLVLDDGDCFVGDLSPFEYIEAFEDSEALKKDWEKLLSLGPKRIYFAHMPGKVLDGQE
ncbi:MAG: MBL fold metallo-hydrolase, partial [Firmicutes bacterium]|nr:MBL fold metallo-hydrolase [Bacillota bacterium]